MNQLKEKKYDTQYAPECTYIVVQAYSDAAQIEAALYSAFDLGHEFGRDRAADVVDQCNREGPYNAIGAASRIRALSIVHHKPNTVTTVSSDFLSETPDAE